MTNYNFLPKGLKSDLGWYKRNLPHFDGGEIPQFLTFRLFDSLPQSVLQQFREETEGQGKAGEAIFRKNVEKYLDNGYGQCFLKNRDVAQIVANSLRFHDGAKYLLDSWVIMPNHAHILATPFPGIELSEIAHSIKSYTAHEANKVLGRTGQFWQHEPFDRYIRNSRHYWNVVRYIENNPVKAGLCREATDWEFSSAFKGT
ncbi:MAG TPA: transposase [Pyrinomonadaceae bacterium]|nr:transposase [Pyrinomonadaceae bacterium]